MSNLKKIQSKIVSLANLTLKVDEWKKSGQKIVFTNGCFDLIHRGHVEVLSKTADLGEKLIVGLNSDISIKKLKGKNNLVIGYGAPAKATTALNFYGIKNEIDFIVEDNKLKLNKFIPGVKIPIKKKSEIKNKKNTIVVLAWNFFQDIKNNNSELSDNFINIKDLE